VDFSYIRLGNTNVIVCDIKKGMERSAGETGDKFQREILISPEKA